MKKLLFSVGCLLLILNILTAQHHEENESLQTRFDKSELVIEGKIIDQESYFDELRRLVFTKHQIEVYKSFKGSNSNLIEFYTVGGQTENHGLIVSHQEKFHLGQEGIFFLQHSNLERTQPSGHAIRFYNDYRSPAEEKGKVYKDIQTEIYNPLQDFAGQSYQTIQLNSMEKLVEEWVQEVVASPDDCETAIEYGIENVTYSFPNIEFDITAKSNVEELLLSKASLLLNYPTSLGSNIVVNEIFTATKDDLIDSNNYTLVTTDESSQKVKMEIDGGNNFTQMNELELTPKAMLHIQVVLNSIIQAGTSGFDNASMQGESEFYDPINHEAKPFRCVFTSEGFDFKFVDFTFFPPIVNAGVRDTLFIVGTGFGDVEGKVFFRNADQPDSLAFNYFVPIAQDHVTWSSEFIEVEVLSLKLDGGFTGRPASGEIKVQLADNTFVENSTNSEIEVFYSISNINLDEKRINLANKDGEGGYIFHMSTALNSITNAREVVEQILQDWQNETCVNFKLSPETIDNPVEAMDNLNIIHWSTFADTAVLMQTFSHLDTISPNGSGMQVAWINDIDILINQEKPWYIGVLPITDTTRFDFYAALSHEIGHGHQLNHVLGEQSTSINKLMYPFRGKGVETRIVGGSAKNGGIDVMNNNPIELNGGLADPPMEKIDGCLTPIRNVAFNPQVEFLVFPNPVKNELHIQTNFPLAMTANLVIFDVVGKPILQSNILKIPEGLNNEISLNLDKFPKGIYFILLETEIGFSTKKFTKL